MSDPTPSDSAQTRETETAGLKQHSESLKVAIRDYASARLELLAIESKEASQVLGERAGKAIAAAILLIFAWGCLLAMLILIGERLTSSFPGGLQRIGGGAIVALILSILHALVAIPFVKAVKQKLTQPLFQYTKSELQKDREWIDQTTR